MLGEKLSKCPYPLQTHNLYNLYLPLVGFGCVYNNPSMRWMIALLGVGLAFSYDVECRPTVKIEEAIRQASQFVGEVSSISLSRNKKGECYYRVRGSEGTALIDANSGKLLRFYRKN